MDRTERFYRIDQRLKQSPASFAVLQESLGVSRATLKRDLGIGSIGHRRALLDSIAELAAVAAAASKALPPDASMRAPAWAASGCAAAAMP